MKLTVNQALALIRAEALKADGPIKNLVVRQIGQLVINVERLGVGLNEVLSLSEPPPRSGRRSKKRSAPKADVKSASNMTGRRN